MATINFPGNPTIGQLYDFGPNRFRWDGQKWSTIGNGFNQAAILTTQAREALRRTYADAGLTLVDGSFEAGGTINSPSDVLLNESNSKAYSWGGAYPKIVPSASTPASSGGIGVGAWSDRSMALLRAWATPEEFGGVSYPYNIVIGDNSAQAIQAAVTAGTIVDSSSAIQAAIDSGRPVDLSTGLYFTSKPIVQGQFTGQVLGRDSLQTAIVKYTDTVDPVYGVDAVWIVGDGSGSYMRYKDLEGFTLARARLLINDGSLQKPKAIEDFFDWTNISHVPYGYGLYVPKADHISLTNIRIHGSETNLYSADCWMSVFDKVWTRGGNGYVIESGTSITMSSIWAERCSWNTYDTVGNLIKKYYPYDIGGVYHDIGVVACDYAGADGRPCESLYKFRQGAIIGLGSLGAEQCHARRIIDTTVGASGFTTSFVDVNTISVDMFYNKYADQSLPESERVLINVANFCSLGIKSGKIRSVYATQADASPGFKPHIGRCGVTARAILGSVYFFADTIKGVQLNDVSYWTIKNYATGAQTPVPKTESEWFVESNAVSASSFKIKSGVLDIQVAGSGSDLFWDNGSTLVIEDFAYRRGYCAKVQGTGSAILRAENGSRSVELLTNGASAGLYDRSTNSWLLRQDQGSSGSSLTLGSKFSAQDVIYNFQTAGNGAAYNSRFVARTVGASHNLHVQASQFSPFTDNNIPNGGPSNRWSVVYAGTGAINTSDGREKTTPVDINDKLLDVADSISISVWKWIESVARKGNEARWHFGPIAQQVRDAFVQHGLDGCEYGLLCYDRWDDEYEPILEEVTEYSGEDDETKTVRVVDTGEKRLKKAAGDRWGIRPDQCLWLKMAATDRRCARIEDRLSKAGL